MPKRQQSSSRKRKGRKGPHPALPAIPAEPTASEADVAAAEDAPPGMPSVALAERQAATPVGFGAASVGERHVKRDHTYVRAELLRIGLTITLVFAGLLGGAALMRWA